MRSADATPQAPGDAASLPPTGPLPTSSAAAAAAPQQQPPQQPEQEQQRRRRGRKPIPVEQMTEKQPRIREQNQRFKDKQAAKVREAEAALEAASAQLEQERAHQQQELQTSMAYEQLVDYKSEMVGALQVAAELDPPHGVSIPKEMLHVLAKEEVIEEFGWDMIMRYAVGGYKEHIGPNGWVNKAPPFEAEARDWADIANKMRAVLNEARVPRHRPAESAGSEGAATPTRREGRARETAPWEVQELDQPNQEQQQQQQQQEQHPQQQQQQHPQQQQQQQQQQHQQQLQQEQQEQQEGGSAPPMPQGASQPPVGEAATAATAAAALGPGSTAGAAASAGGAAGMVGDKGPPNLAQLIAKRDKLPPHRAELQGGMAVQDGDDLYRFTGGHVLQSSLLFRRIALICWQQAALFPDNANKLVSMNLETCAGYEEQELPRWRAVVRQMRFSPDELEKVVGLHKEYIAMLRPALLQRREALQRLRELHAEPKLASQQDLMRKSLVANECNSTLMSSVHTLNAATGAMSAGLWKMLQFPLGIFKMVLMSWPYYPQLHLIGLAAAEELGLDMDVYTSFNELFANLSEGQQAGEPFGTELWAAELAQG